MSASVTDDTQRPARGQPLNGRKVLESLPTAARTTGEKAAARSRLVQRLRIALPVLAFALIIAFFLNTRSNDVDQAFLKDFESMTASTEELRMANPRFAGIDNRGKPFEITANAAKQDPGDRESVELEMPRAVQGEKGDETVVTAAKGVYRSEPNILELSDGVMLEHNIGVDTFVLRAPAATVQIKDEIVFSDAGIGGVGPDGKELKADSMKAYRSEGRVVFEGNVSMRIYPKPSTSETIADTAAEPSSEGVQLKDPK